MLPNNSPYSGRLVSARRNYIKNRLSGALGDTEQADMSRKVQGAATQQVGAMQQVMNRASMGNPMAVQQGGAAAVAMAQQGGDAAVRAGGQQATLAAQMQQQRQSEGAQMANSLIEQRRNRINSTVNAMIGAGTELMDAAGPAVGEALAEQIRRRGR